MRAIVDVGIKAITTMMTTTYYTGWAKSPFIVNSTEQWAQKAYLRYLTSFHDRAHTSSY